MSPSGGSGTGGGDEEQIGLLCGLAPWHLRILSDNPFDGGGGYTPAEVGDMTLDQVFFRLAKRDGLRKRGGARQVAPNTVLGPARGRTAAGKPLAGRVAGVSKARQIADAAKARKAVETEAAPPKRRRKRGI